MDEEPNVAAYPCETILFRAIPYSSLLRKDRPLKPGVFFRRERSDPNGLSVTTTVRACKAQFNEPIFGMRSLHAGRLRAYGLELFPTSPTHANIRYVPTRAENETAARNIADDLMAMSRSVPNWEADNADELLLAERSE
jgi:hypothetical protein